MGVLYLKKIYNYRFPICKKKWVVNLFDRWLSKPVSAFGIQNWRLICFLTWCFMPPHYLTTVVWIIWFLTLIVVHLQITNRVQCVLSKQGQREDILSYSKTMNTLKNCFSEILSILQMGEQMAIKLLGEIYQILSKNHWREIRKKRENYVDNTCLYICISN